MSPSEFDLRAFLREGEGPTPSADSVIARAEGIRRARRVRVAQVAAAVVVTGLVGVGVAGLAGGSNRHDASGRAAGGSGATGQRYSGTEVPAGAQSVAGAADPRTAPAPRSSRSGTDYGSDQAASPVAAGCPASPPLLAAPGGGGTGQFGGTGPLFDRPVTAMTVCAYRGSSLTGSTTLSGGTAGDVAAGLNAASPRVTSACPVPTRNAAGNDLALLLASAGGARLQPVVARLACPYFTTNGTAVRYAPLPQPVRAVTEPTAAPVTGSPTR